MSSTFGRVRRGLTATIGIVGMVAALAACGGSDSSAPSPPAPAPASASDRPTDPGSAWS